MYLYFSKYLKYFLHVLSILKVELSKYFYKILLYHKSIVLLVYKLKPF